MNGTFGRRGLLFVAIPFAGLLETALITYFAPQTEWKFVLVVGACSGIVLSVLAWALWREHRRQVSALEARVKLLQGEVTAADLSLRTTLAGAAHDLSQPLTALHGTLEIALLSSATGADQRSVLEDAIQHAESAVTLTRLFAQFADAGAKGRATEPTPLDALLSNLCADLESAAQAGGAQLVWRCESSLVAVANPADLRRAILYLMEHALDRSTPGGSVEVNLERDGSAARIVIGDQGLRIPAEDLPHWFEPFYCGSSSATKNRGSVRLAIVERSITACVGSVTATNGGEKGARFIVRLPLA